jgi:hypothetical protein
MITYFLLNKKIKKIMSNQQDALNKLDAIEAKQNKIEKEYKTAIAEKDAEIDELKSQLQDGGNVSDDIMSKIDAIDAKADELDNITPDAPVVIDNPPFEEPAPVPVDDPIPAPADVPVDEPAPAEDNSGDAPVSDGSGDVADLT